MYGADYVAYYQWLEDFRWNDSNDPFSFIKVPELKILRRLICGISLNNVKVQDIKILVQWCECLVNTFYNIAPSPSNFEKKKVNTKEYMKELFDEIITMIDISHRWWIIDREDIDDMKAYSKHLIEKISRIVAFERMQSIK